jgi:predicted DCC family thiol-disulfide oxidoreductase YuxK
MHETPARPTAARWAGRFVHDRRAPGEATARAVGDNGGVSTLARPAPPVLVYDGDCGICTKLSRFARRFVMPRHGTVIASFDLDLADYGLTAEQCLEALQFVDARGRTHAAQDAVARLLLAAAPWWKPFGALLLLPGVHALAGAAYRWVARNRYRLPGATDACALPPAAIGSPSVESSAATGDPAR